jgi:Tfp pilus assembly protein PilO
MMYQLRTLISQLTRQPRTLVLAATAGCVLCTAVVLEKGIFPKWDQLQRIRGEVALLSAQKQRYLENLSVRERVNAQFAALPSDVFRDQSNDQVLSRFLVHVETHARRPGLGLTNARPGEVRHTNQGSFYSVRLSLAGPLSEILRFVHAVCAGSQVVGLEDFSLRAVQGQSTVEAVMNLEMVQLDPDRRLGREADS